MATTIQISDDIKKVLDRMKMFERESYNEVIERMVEDDRELNQKTKLEIEAAKKRIASGKFLTQEQVEKKFSM